MLTKLTIRNFKRFNEVEIELGNPVVFVGPNNSGKTSAMQALALWDLGVKRWHEKKAGKNKLRKRQNVTINRQDLVAIPQPRTRLMWRDLHIRTRSDQVHIELIVEGMDQGKSWTCGMEFTHANDESFYCQPLRLKKGDSPEWMPVPEQAVSVRTVLLPPMSGLAATETRLDQGAINVRVGEGRTAEVLRNLCFKLVTDDHDRWQGLIKQMKSLFGVELGKPQYIDERGEITMEYQDNGATLDLSSSGRGLQQTLLILAYMAANPGAIVLLDEPDAHLEILRQRQVYDLLAEAAEAGDNQIIAATHSEVLLNEAAGKDLAIAFIGKPHAIRQSSQVRKALAELGYDQYYQAESTGWILYLEGSTDLAILRALAKRLDNTSAAKALERPFVHYVSNQPNAARHHFFGLREAVPRLNGIAIFDRLESKLPDSPPLEFMTWRRREIENYLCTERTLEEYALHLGTKASAGPLFTEAEANRWLKTMQDAIAEVSEALMTLKKEGPWDIDTKVSDEFLTPLFEKYFQNLELPNLMTKKSFYELASYIPVEEIDPEINEKLDAIARVANSASLPPS